MLRQGWTYGGNGSEGPPSRGFPFAYVSQQPAHALAKGQSWVTFWACTTVVMAGYPVVFASLSISACILVPRYILRTGIYIIYTVNVFVALPRETRFGSPVLNGLRKKLLGREWPVLLTSQTKGMT